MSNIVKHLYAFDKYLLDVEERHFLKDGHPIALEPKEFDVLAYMVKNPRRLLKKEELMDGGWGKGATVEEQRLVQTVSGIRRKAFNEEEKEYIETVRYEGYRFVADVQNKSHLPDEACPWVGLRAFDEMHSQCFFGREEEIKTLLSRLKSEKFLAIVGASGRGKSSLARAGIVPALRHNSTPNQEWRLEILRPTFSPLRQLSIALLDLSGIPPTEKATDTLVKQLGTGTKVIIQYLTSNHIEPPPPKLLLVDQFEEVFSHSVDSRERVNFIENLLAAVCEPSKNIFVILIIHTRYLQELENYSNLWRLVSDHQYGVSRLMPDDLRMVIQKPAELAGLELEDGLVDEILEDLGDAPGNLPLLSHTMTELFKKREGFRLTLAAYRAIGKVSGAIAQHADSVFASLNPTEQSIARHVLLSLVDPGLKPENDVGRRITFEELVTGPGKSQEVEFVVRKLDNERLLTTGSEGEMLSSRRGERRVWVEISHVALIQHWPKLAKWVNEKRNALRFFHTLEDDAKDWKSANKDPELLYQRHKLEHSLDVYESYAEFMKDLHREFLQTSQKAEKGRRWKRQGIKGLIAAVALLLIISAIVTWKWQDTKHQLDLVNSLMRAADSISQLSFDPELSLLLAVESGKLKLTSQTESALRQALAASRVRAVFRGHRKQVISVDLSPDGKYLLTGSLDGEARIWDVVTGQTIRTLSGHSAGITWATYSPDGGKIVTASRDGMVLIWDANTGIPLKELRGHTEPVNHAIFSRDGSRVLTAGDDKTARIWDARTGQALLELKDHQMFVNTVACSPDGKWIATASGEKTARVWDANTGEQVAALKGHQGTVFHIAFSPDGKNIVTASRDRTSRIWEVGTWTERLVLTGHSLNVNSAEFSPDGRLILTSSKDGTARLWNAQTGKELLQLLGHSSAINMAIFSRDGQFVFTASGDHTVRMWAVDFTQSIAKLEGHTGTVYSAVFNPNGDKIVTAGADGTARIWDVRTGRQLRMLARHHPIHYAVFSPDGKLVATVGDDQIGRLWDEASGKLKKELIGHKGKLNSIAFSSDGTKAVTASADHTAQTWDIKSGQRLKELAGNGDELSQAVYSPDGRWIATACTDSTVRVWNAITAQKEFEWKVETGSINSIAISPDNKYLLVSCADQTARVWDLNDQSAVSVLRGHELKVNSAEFSPNGTLVATASDDQTIRLWELGSGQLLFQMIDQDAPIRGVAFSPNGRLLTAANEKGKVVIYTCEICGATGEELLRLAETRKTRNLTLGEKARFLTLTR